MGISLSLRTHLSMCLCVFLSLPMRAFLSLKLAPLCWRHPLALLDYFSLYVTTARLTFILQVLCLLITYPDILRPQACSDAGRAAVSGGRTISVPTSSTANFPTTRSKRSSNSTPSLEIGKSIPSLFLNVQTAY